MVETANGKGIKNYNFGNLSAGGIYNGVEKIVYPTYWRPPWYADPSNPIYDRMQNGLAPSAFQAYGSPSEGMAAYVRLLKSRGYEPLVSAAAANDATTFVTALHDTGYSRDYGPGHVPTFELIVQRIRGSSPSATQMQVASGANPVQVALAVGGLGAVGLTLYWVWRRRARRKYSA